MEQLKKEDLDNILSYAENEQQVNDPEILDVLISYSRLWVVEGGTTSPSAVWAAFVKSPVYLEYYAAPPL